MTTVKYDTISYYRLVIQSRSHPFDIVSDWYVYVYVLLFYWNLSLTSHLWSVTCCLFSLTPQAFFIRSSTVRKRKHQSWYRSRSYNPIRPINIFQQAIKIAGGIKKRNPKIFLAGVIKDLRALTTARYHPTNYTHTAYGIRPVRKKTTRGRDTTH